MSAHVSVTVTAMLMCMIAAGGEQWQPLLRPSLLETQWQKLDCLWQSLGFLPEAASADKLAAFADYVESGSYPSHSGMLLLTRLPMNTAAGVVQRHACFMLT